jgi:hypothetical protein
MTMNLDQLVMRIRRESLNLKQTYNLNVACIYVDRATYNLVKHEVHNSKGHWVADHHRNIDDSKVTILGIDIVPVLSESHFGLSVTI